MGSHSLGSVTTGGDNTACGYDCGGAITTGTNNLMLGKEAGGGSSPGGTITTSSNNVVLGNNSISNCLLYTSPSPRD